MTTVDTTRVRRTSRSGPSSLASAEPAPEADDPVRTVGSGAERFLEPIQRLFGLGRRGHGEVAGGTQHQKDLRSILGRQPREASLELHRVVIAGAEGDRSLDGTHV